MKRLNSESSITLITIIVVLCCGVISAYANDTIEAVGSDQATEMSELNEEHSELDLRMQKTVSIDVSDVPIEMVIRQLTEQVNVDFIISPNVTGNVTVTLTDVSVEEALQSILDVHGCAFLKGKNIVRIIPRDEVPVITDRLVTQTFEIIYADVEQVVEALQKFLSAQGKVSYIKGTSYLIVTDTEAKIREIAKLIEKIDKTGRRRCR